MCGFIGIFDFNGLSENDYNDIRKATIETNYRGPNDSGFYKSDRCGIGFNRLSIVDLNAKSQPLINENKNIILVCNGEIYNYLSLKKELEAKYVFEQMSKLVEFSIDNNTTIYKLEKQLGKLKNDFRKNYDLIDKNIELNTVKEI